MRSFNHPSLNNDFHRRQENARISETDKIKKIIENWAIGAEANLFACRLQPAIDEAARRVPGKCPKSGRFPSGSARSSSFGESPVTATSGHQKVILTSRERGFQF